MRPVHSVLVVEDSFMLLEIIAQLCASQGTRVIEASSGEAALTILRERGPTIDWLFTDINLPGGVDGTHLAQLARKLRPELPVVFASGRYGTIQELDAVPGAAFVAKPYNPFKVCSLLAALSTKH